MEENNKEQWKEDFSVDNNQSILQVNSFVTKGNVDQADKAILVEADKKVREQNSRRGKLFSFVFLLLNFTVLGVVLLYLSQKLGVKHVSEMLTNISQIKWFWIALSFVLLSMLIETCRTQLLLYRTTRTFRPALSYKSTAIEKFYDAVTPFSIGGQPFQVLYMHKRGVGAGVATSIPLAKTMVSQMVFVLLSFLILLCNIPFMNQSNAFIISLSALSLIIITLLVSALFFLSVSKKLAPKMLLATLKFLNKIHLVKHYQLAFERIMKGVLEYQKSIRYYTKSPLTMLGLVLLSLGYWVIKASIPFAIYVAFTPNPTTSYFTIFAGFILCELASKIIPLPGSAGIAEISFSALFASLFADGTIFWAVLLWRLLTFYIYLIQGGLVIAYDLFWGNRKKTYAQKRQDLHAHKE